MNYVVCRLLLKCHRIDKLAWPRPRTAPSLADMSLRAERAMRATQLNVESSLIWSNCAELEREGIEGGRAC
jgi:hypothetical protein